MGQKTRRGRQNCSERDALRRAAVKHLVDIKVNVDEMMRVISYWILRCNSWQLEKRWNIQFSFVSQHFHGSKTQEHQLVLGEGLSLGEVTSGADSQEMLTPFIWMWTGVRCICFCSPFWKPELAALWPVKLLILSCLSQLASAPLACHHRFMIVNDFCDLGQV